MLADSFFVSPRVHEREVELPDGSKHTLHFRELPAVEFIKFRNTTLAGSEDAQAGATCRLVAASLCDADGKPELTLDRALTLTSLALKALFQAVMAVNGQATQKGEEDAAGNA